MFDDQVNLNQYLYHYTSYTTFLEKISPTQKLRLSPFKNTNDPRETKNWAFSMSLPTVQPKEEEFFYIQNKFNSLLKDNSKIICFTRDNPSLDDYLLNFLSSRGFAHSRMWAQYAGNHTGVCLIFDKYKLIKIFEEELSDKGTIYHDVVNYGTESRSIYNAFHINYDELRMKEISEFAREHIEKYIRELFFEKMLDWKEEWEYRWVFLSDKKNDYEFVNYKDALETIILGLDFPEVYYPLIVNYCKKYKISAHRMSWSNGFSVIPLYINETNESFFNTNF